VGEENVKAYIDPAIINQIELLIDNIHRYTDDIRMAIWH
jgi:hypothetical protein